MSNDNRHTILILGSRAPIALEMVRSFGKQGYRVLCADSIKFPIARFGKYCTEYLKHPAPNLDFAGFKYFLKKAIKEKKIEHIIPTSEEAFHLSKLTGELDCKVWVSEIDLMTKLHNKYSFIKLANKYFDVPKTILYTSFDDYTNTSKYVFKPIFSRFGRNVLINKSYEFVKQTIDEPQKWIAQEKIEGQQICSYSIFDKGKLKSNICYIPKYLYKGGAGMLFKPIENKLIFERIKIFGAAIKFTGQLSFDFIINNNKPFVIECNPRGTSGAHLLGKHIEKAFFSKDFDNLNKIKHSMALKLPILFDNPGSIFEEEFRRSKDVIVNKKDLLPVFGQVLSIAELYFKKIIKRKSLEEIMTYEFEYNGI